MKKLVLSLFVLIAAIVGNAQNNKHSNKVHKIVFQLASDDSLVHKGLMKQLNNVLTAAPDAKIEVVCHGPGIYMLIKDKTTVHDKIQEMKTRGIVFAACENTLKDRNISKDKVIAEAVIVPSALIEIITKQEQGWSYIKAGN